MTITTAYHVGSNVPDYLPENDVTCWDTPREAREALLTVMYLHCDDLAEACDHNDYEPECDDCDDWHVAKTATDDVAMDGRAGWENGISIQLPTGRALPLAFWMERVDMDHAAECEPLDN